MTMPIYQDIINIIQNKIKSGTYGPDEKLPSEAQLMEEFSTSRITVTRALKELEHRGIIYREKGKGSFVSPPRPQETQSKIISLVLPHKEDFFSGGQQYSRGIYRSCQEEGYLCSVHYSEQSHGREKEILQEIIRHDVAGAIIYPIGNRNIETLSRMSIEGFPLVLLDRQLRELDLPVVTSDNFKGAREAVTYMAGHGHKRIAFVGAMDSDVVSWRYQGYCRALMDYKIILDPEIVVTHYSHSDKETQETLVEEDAHTILETLLEKGVTAIFCVNDLIAFRILHSAEKLNLSIPDDLSITGFDNMKYFGDMAHELTTVAQDFDAISRECVSLLMNAIGAKKQGAIMHPENRIVPTTFMAGSTVQKLI